MGAFGRLRAVAAVGVLGLLLGCGPGGTLLGFQQASYTGNWTGAWASDNGTSGGVLTLELLQVGPIVQGTATFTNSTCYTTGSVGGTANGGALTGTIDFAGNAVAVQLTVTGNTLSGRYVDGSAGACNGDAGDYDANRP